MLILNMYKKKVERVRAIIKSNVIVILSNQYVVALLLLDETVINMVCIKFERLKTLLFVYYEIKLVKINWLNFFYNQLPLTK